MHVGTLTRRARCEDQMFKRESPTRRCVPMRRGCVIGGEDKVTW